VVSCRDSYEKGIGHDHLFAERSDLLFGVAIRGAIVPARFVEKSRRFFQKERIVFDVLHSIWVGMI
jgi:hypothetical protein